MSASNGERPVPSDWLTEAEASVHRTSDLLAFAGNLDRCHAELEAAATHLRQASAKAQGAGLDADTRSRLGALRNELMLLQSAVKYGAALRSGLEQLDTAVIGYTPAGLERTL